MSSTLYRKGDIVKFLAILFSLFLVACVSRQIAIESADSNDESYIGSGQSQASDLLARKYIDIIPIPRDGTIMEAEGDCFIKRLNGDRFVNVKGGDKITNEVELILNGNCYIWIDFGVNEFIEFSKANSERHVVFEFQ